MTSPIDDETLAYQMLAQQGHRLTQLEMRAERADAQNESAEKERARQGKDLAELRQETSAGFKELREDLKPLVMMASAGRFVFWGFVLCIPILVGLTQLFDKAWSWLSSR